MKKTNAEHKQRRTWEMRQMSSLRAKAGLTYACGKLDPADIAARLSEIPADTRNLTQRINGDPLPGRSALDRRNSMVAN
jgi:hypothetical protein